MQLGTALSEKLVELSGISRIVSVQSDANKSFNALSKRRVHQDGVYMLDTHLTMRDQLQQMTIMENRIKRLLFEEDRARKLQDMAKQKAEKMLEARERHQKELSDKFRYYEQKINTIQEAKQRNLSEKFNRKENIQKVKEELFLKNHSNKQEIHEIRNHLTEQKSKYLDDDMTLKKQKKYEILQNKNIHLSKKINNLEAHHQDLKQNYSSRLMEKKMSADEAAAKIKKLEQVEMALIDRLKNTHTKQQMAYKDLEKIVHDGYGYYLNSYKEKRDKHSQLFSNGKTLQSRNDSVQYLTSPSQNISTIEPKSSIQQL